MKKIKKIALNIFVSIQILLLLAGSVPAASAASWASLRYDLDEDEIPSAIKDEGEYEAVASYKKNDQTPKVSIIYSPTDPKVGEKVTATAVAQPFANDTEDLYYTWFLKQKQCALEDDENDDGVKKNRFEVNSQEYSEASESERNSYPSHAEIVNTDAEAAACDVDEDGMVTVNDWKVEAARIVAQDGFKPDLKGRFEGSSDAASLSNFYADNSDSDGYRTWQGGADAERMPNHCFGYDATTGMIFEFLDRQLESTPLCPKPGSTTGEKIPAVCGKTINWTTAEATENTCDCGQDDTDGDTLRQHSQCNNCTDGQIHNVAGNITSDSIDPFTRTDPTNGNPLSNPPGAGDLMTPHPIVGAWPNIPAGCSSGGSDDVTSPCPASADGVVQWYECMIDTIYCHPEQGTTYPSVGGTIPTLAGASHGDCKKQETQMACEKQAALPRCERVTSGEHQGELAAVCGNSRSGIDSREDRGNGIAMCPSRGTFKIFEDASPVFDFSQSDLSDIQASPNVLTYDENEYVYGTGAQGAYDPYDNLPACGCAKIREEMISPQGVLGEPYIGSGNAPLCEDSAPEIDDLLCGSLTLVSGARTTININHQFHLFPQRITGNNDNYYELTRNYFDDDNDEKFRYRKGNTTGDDDFGRDEEEFWGTDPRNPSTSQNGKADEANVAGLGAKTFTWTYQAGDEVGVAVEGTSNIGTKFPDSSRMIMWAFSKGADQATSEDGTDVDCQPKYSGSYNFENFENAQRVPFSSAMIPEVLQMPTGFMDFDRCIEKSAVPVVVGEGANGAQPKAMEVELSVSPDKPLNDENETGKGDVVDVSSIISGNSGPENDVSYSWEIKAFHREGTASLPAETDWAGVEPICEDGNSTCPLLDEDGKRLKLKGTGLSGINFKLDIADAANSITDLYDTLFNDDGEGYFQISVEAREDDDAVSPPASRVGSGSAVVKVSTNENRITVFRPAISGGRLAVPVAATGDAARVFPCSSPEERALCPVLKNEIVGLSVGTTAKGELLTDFAWSVDGSAVDSCDEQMSSACVSGGVSSNYIPVTGEIGDTFTVSVKGTNVSGKIPGSGQDPATGKNVELSQRFQVVEPSINIISVDENGVWPKLIGRSEDSATGASADDFSKTVLETSAGSNASLGVEYSPSSLADLNLPVAWQIDGIPSAAGSFTAGAVGGVHNISASATYVQSTEMNLALNTLFGVSKSQMQPQTMTDSIQVEVNREAAPTAFKNPTRFLANLFSRIPAQVLFLIRLILSVTMALVLVGSIFAFFPEVSYNERRKW